MDIEIYLFLLDLSIYCQYVFKVCFNKLLSFIIIDYNVSLFKTNFINLYWFNFVLCVFVDFYWICPILFDFWRANSLILCSDRFISTSLISAMIFTIYYFSIFPLYFWLVLFLRPLIIPLEFAPRTAFILPHRFCYIWFSFSFKLRYF